MTPVPTPALRAVRVVDVDTPAGLARAHVHEPRGAARSVLMLGHGAGGGVEARDLQALAASLPAEGHRVVLVEAPWRVAGKRVAAAPRTLDVGWLAVVEALSGADLLGDRFVVGGRSAGARVACRTATATGAAAALLLSFPLHPPGRPEKSRADELGGAGVPTHVVQGERDPFGPPSEVTQALPGQPVTGIPFADHGFAVPKSAPLTQAEALGLIVEGARRALVEWSPTPRR